MIDDDNSELQKIQLKPTACAVCEVLLMYTCNSCGAESKKARDVDIRRVEICGPTVEILDRCSRCKTEHLIIIYL